MASKLSSAMQTLREDGVLGLSSKIREELFPKRDRVAEIQSPAADLYDCFIFYNELDLLWLRLNELDDLVDKYVIIEASETFQGDDKPLYFNDSQDRFAKFESKLVHHIVDYPSRLTDSWEREYYLRNSIQRALKQETNIARQDEVLVSDVDEIPRPESIRYGLNLSGVKVFAQTLHYYYYNYVHEGNTRWLGPVMAPYDCFTSAQDFRDRYTQHKESVSLISMNTYLSLLEVILSIGNLRRVRIVNNAGWHFSYLGDVEFIIDKIESFSHSELDRDKYKKADRIQTAIERGEDLFNQGMRFDRVGINNQFPNYLSNNRTEFAENIIDHKLSDK